MPGRFITDRQYEDYMNLRTQHTQHIAAAKAGFSQSTGSRLDRDPRPPSQKKQDRRHGGGKPDPLADFWDQEVLPMIEAEPRLRPVTVLEEMKRRHPDRDWDSMRRTLERRMRRWRARHGPDREVIFRQNHPIGHQGMSDFCVMDKMKITIAGQLFLHRLFHFALVYSGWEYAEVVLGGESFTAFSSGLQNALWQLGGAPKDCRTDSLSAAFANLNPVAREDMQKRYEDLIASYGMEPSRNNRGEAHENGSIESRHGHLRSRIEQALLLRGSRDFDTVDDLRDFVAEIVARHNAQRQEEVKLERAELLPLPDRRSCDYDTGRVRVTSSSGFVFRRVFYTVPSRLIGFELNLRVYDDRLEVFLGDTRIETLPRGRAPDRGRGTHAHVVNYHHVIHSLRTKPGAFANLTYRDALFPRTEYRRAWDALSAALPVREASRTLVGLLWLAHEHACEADLAVALDQTLRAGDLPDLDALRERFEPTEHGDLPDIPVLIPAAAVYDNLLTHREAVT